MPKKHQNGKVSRGPRNKYPWDDWFRILHKQRVLNLKKPKDFKCKLHGMAQQVRNNAAALKIEVSLKLFDTYIEVTLV